MTSTNTCKLLSVGKVIQKNQLDATIIYWSTDQLNMFRANFCPSSEAWDWDFYSIWYPVVEVGRESVSGSMAL